MRYLFAVVVVGAVMLLGACGGQAAQDDPFLGTWRDVESPDVYRLVIASGDSGYEAFVYTGGEVPSAVGPIPLQRAGAWIRCPTREVALP